MLVNIIASIDVPDEEGVIDALFERLPGLSATAGVDCFGRTGVTFTVESVSLQAALTEAFSRLARWPVVSIEALPAEEFDRRSRGDLDDMSVTQAAAALGVTRQAVLKRISSGSLPAFKIGQHYVIPGHAVVALQRSN